MHVHSRVYVCLLAAPKCPSPSHAPLGHVTPACARACAYTCACVSACASACACACVQCALVDKRACVWQPPPQSARYGRRAPALGSGWPGSQRRHRRVGAAKGPPAHRQTRMTGVVQIGADDSYTCFRSFSLLKSCALPGYGCASEASLFDPRARIAAGGIVLTVEEQGHLRNFHPNEGNFRSQKRPIFKSKRRLRDAEREQRCEAEDDAGDERVVRALDLRLRPDQQRAARQRREEHRAHRRRER
eukprot:6186790-Pleurochrysis_carterae.AAC.3